jgi:hypothetical protein
MNTRRVSLAAAGAKAAERPTDVGPPQATSEPPTASAERPKRSRPPRAAKPTAHVRFDELERKETRLRADQLEALATTTKTINRSRRRGGERITDNTLIRVAVDLLLARAGDLSGSTEAELRKSVGL